MAAQARPAAGPPSPQYPRPAAACLLSRPPQSCGSAGPAAAPGPPPPPASAAAAAPAAAPPPRRPAPRRRPRPSPGAATPAAAARPAALRARQRTAAQSAGRWPAAAAAAAAGGWMMLFRECTCVVWQRIGRGMQVRALLHGAAPGDGRRRRQRSEGRPSMQLQLRVARQAHLPAVVLCSLAAAQEEKRPSRCCRCRAMFSNTTPCGGRG